jgi:branched-chain amino acid transport system permease protein
VSNAAAPVPKTLPVALALKDATLAGAVAFGLFFFMIGLRSEQGSTGALEISTRFQTFAIMVAVVFVARYRRP